MSDDFNIKLAKEMLLIGRVISQATIIENMINAYLADFYTQCKNSDYEAPYLAFIYDIMNDRGVSLDTKLNILSKVYIRKFGDKSKLNRTVFNKWLKIRNIFAHGNYTSDKGILYGGEFFSVTELADNHAKLQLKVNSELEKLADLRGSYFNHFPIKNI